ncbi:hypothetical protein C4D60_Mb01t12700 [Musa balbisiana]|uniref:Uncharacterized protein n=1 Tax=Musa balbisiana TaxID=52838 RepID=A0A4S8JP80_MUSBA|nr:hypothetical protein C4D60_Mb01t12700 [Musa balbisiana]
MLSDVLYGTRSYEAGNVASTKTSTRSHEFGSGPNQTGVGSGKPSRNQLGHGRDLGSAHILARRGLAQSRSLWLRGRRGSAQSCVAPCGPVRAGAAQNLKRPRSPADSPSCDQHLRLTSAGFIPLQARPVLTPGFSPQRLWSPFLLESRSDPLLRLNQTVFFGEKYQEKEDMECDKQTQDWYI